MSIIPKPYGTPSAYQCSDYKHRLRWKAPGASYGLARLLPYKPLEPMGLTCYFSWCSHATNNDTLLT